MTVTTLKCVVRYDGAQFAGWQRQPGKRTVQGELEAALSRIANTAVAIQGAGRTDAGVHALGQVFSCCWPGEAPARLSYAVARMVGPEIRIESQEVAPPSFNARFGAAGKRYVYAFDCNRRPDPFAARYAWHVPRPMNMAVFTAGLKQALGAHDFAGFQSAGNQMANTRRTIYAAFLRKGGWCGAGDADGLFCVELVGDGFLYKMVRNLCGTLVEIARGRFPENTIAAMLQQGGPFCGHCAPAQGLALANVYYERDTFSSVINSEPTGSLDVFRP